MPGFPRPFLGQSVRLRAGEDFDDLVAVAEVDDESVLLQASVTADAAHLLYASRAAAVHLSGSIADVGDGLSRFTVAETETFQRREAFRVPMGVPATVRRANGTELECAVADLSPGGALLSPEADGLLLGERVELIVDRDGLRDLPLAAEVIRRDGARRALRFEALSVRADNLLSRAITEAQLRRRQ